MKQQKRFFPEQTHFIGVLLPEGIAGSLENCREYMRERYGCRSGQRTPLHVTLIPPFKLDDSYSERDLADAVYDAENTAHTENVLPFEVSVNGFGAFAERTVYAHVEAEASENGLPASQKFARWAKLRNIVYEKLNASFPQMIRRDTRPFTPHITVANRDIPSGAVAEALQFFSGLNFAEKFTASELTLFRRENGLWQAV